MNDIELCAYLQIEVKTLDLWVQQRWLVPQESGGVREFQRVDLARGLLILDLIGPMGVNEDGVDVAMNLLDQVHALRAKLGDLVSALREEEMEVQKRILSRVNFE